MDYKAIWRKEENRIIPFICLAVLFLIIGVRFDYYLDLNDDVLIRDILSGTYTGTPELLNVQMLTLLSGLLGLLYRLIPEIPVFGIFLWGCQAVSLYLILNRSMRYAKSSWGKWLLASAETLTFSCMIFYHLVFVQYTVTCGLLMAAAIFLFLTSDTPAGTAARFLRKNLPSFLLAFLAYNLRSEMMLMLLPLAAIAGLWKWMDEKPFFCKRNFCCYLGFFGMILGGMLFSEGVDRIAYSENEWSEFRDLFDARTEIYDFKSANIRVYESNREFFDSVGLSEAETELLLNYNYGVSEKVDAEMLETVAQYGREKEGYLAHTVGEGIWLYRERLSNNRELGFDEMPFLLIDGVLIVCLLLAALRWKNGWLIGKLVLLAGGRSVIWMYLILRERVPERLSHPLYLVEILMMAALLLELRHKETDNVISLKGTGYNAGISFQRRTGSFFTVSTAALALVLAVSAASIPDEIGRTVTEYERREELTALDRNAKTYYAEHSDSLYLADVMSTVQFSDKLFAYDRAFGNYDIMGGWISKSPHWKAKLAAFGYSSMEEAVFAGENMYLVKKTDASWDWLLKLCEEKGIQAEMEMVDEVSSISVESMEIWRLKISG